MSSASLTGGVSKEVSDAGQFRKKLEDIACDIGDLEN